MSDHMPAEEERRLRTGLEWLSRRAPRAFEPPESMLRRARRRVAGTAVVAAVVVFALVGGGVALSRTLAERPAPPTHHETHAPTPPATNAPTPTNVPASPSPQALACSFQSQPLPDLPKRLRQIVQANGSFQLSSAEGVAGDDVWLGGTVRGDFSKPAVTIGVFLHWDGTTTTVLPPEDDVSVAGIAAIATDDAWALTGVGVLHWDGTTWSPMHARSFDSTDTFAISATGADDVWAVGADSFLTRPVIEHFDGQAWTQVPTPPELRVPKGGTRTIALWGVDAVSPTDAWAVGGYDFAQEESTSQAPVVLHWDGSRWSTVDVPTRSGVAYVGQGVAATGPDDVWVAADAVLPDHEATPGVLLHFDGTTWSEVPLTAPAGTALHLTAVDAPDPNDVWAAGSAVDPASGASVPVIEHFDGAAWSEVPLGGPGQSSEGRIRSIRVIGDEVWAVGFVALDRPPFVSVCRP